MYMDFLPEWKIYLWKKLILNKDGEFDGKLTSRSFAFFNDVEQRRLTRDKVQRTIDAIRVATKSGVLMNAGIRSTDFENSFFHSSPPESFRALVELSQGPKCIEFIKISIDKKLLGPSFSEDKFGGFGEEAYNKIMADKNLTIKDLRFSYFSNYSNNPLFSYLSFEIKIDKEKLAEKLNTYIDDFTAHKFIGPKGARFIDPKKQSGNILAALMKLSERYGSAMVTSSEEVAKAGGWYLREEHNYRFLEALFALERSGNIEIKDLRQSEVVLSLNENIKEEAVPAPVTKKIVAEDIKSITFISENKKADKVSAFYINHHIHDVHKMQRLSSEVRKLARVADGEEVPFEKQTHDYINTNKNCVLYCKGKYKLTKIIDGHSKPLKISRGIEVEVIDDKIFKRRISQTEKVSA